MSKNKFTKGEWSYDDIETNAIYADEDKIICDMNYSCDEISMEEVEANARLIAAAPDLFEACKMLMEIVGDEEVALVNYSNAVDAAEKAIAKAKGAQD